MGYRKEIENAEKFIRKNLTSGITAGDVASRSGYSFFHFCHMFRAITGKGVAAYITDLKLSEARKLLASGKSVTFTAMEMGYDTISGFTKAFTRKYGVSPSEFKLCYRGAGDMKGDIKMEPEIIKKESFKASCLVIRPEEEVDILESGGYWIGKDLPELTASSHEEAFSRASAKVGAWMHDNDGRDLYYIYGDVLEDGAKESGKVIEFPEAEYAVFKVPTASTHEDFVDNLKATWKYIFYDWLDKSPYKFNCEKMDFEYYTADGVSIYVPIEAK